MPEGTGLSPLEDKQHQRGNKICMCWDTLRELVSFCIFCAACVLNQVNILGGDRIEDKKHSLGL